ncbi:MAG: single-stranded-DNA-specific exonuclease RecJ, partial [Clostridia bacterium]|nr:single-stranded-DNA-specific exonuclease RecJ [Clostridia bacterium]
MSVLQKNCINNTVAEKLSRELGIQPLTAKLLASRGFLSSDDARAFLQPQRNDLPDFRAYTGVLNAVQRISQAIEREETIIVYGDYDCDGVCASTILSETIKHLGGKVFVYIPKRLEEGYGLSVEALERIADEHFPDLIITVDCGISAKDEIDYCLNELGIDVIVTDHHEPSANLPDCIIVNPHLDLDKNLYTDFCGAGVAFMLAMTLSSLDFVMNYIDVVAIATMGDIVPLTGANRVLVKYGIDKLLSSPRSGLKQLIDSLGLKSDITGYDLGFKIVPRINSLGRLGDASRAIALFTESDYFVLSCLIKEMNEENAQRQAICEKIEKEALEYAKPFLNHDRAIVLYGDWHKGVLGITASKLAERFHRPVILFCHENGELRGSCRSIEGINIFELLCKFENYFIKFGGHAQAAGVSMDISKFEDFRENFLSYIKENYSDDLFIPSYYYDIDITDQNVSREFLNELKSFEPFGQSNPKPIFHSLVSNCNYQYGKNNPIHINYPTKLGYTVSGFFKGEYLPLLNSDTKTHCFYSLSLNEFNGRVYPQAVLERLEIGEFTRNGDRALEMINFAKTARLPQKEAQVFDKNELYRIILNEFAENPYGNLVVCYDINSFLDISRILDKNGLSYEKFYCAPTTKNTINALIYCPNDKFDFSIYSNVFYADK